MLISKTGGWLPLCMAIDMPPFNDVRVRQAMRLIVDRQAMIEQMLSGYGTVANDLYSPFDAGYDKPLPQREQDIEQAKSLLKAAGQDGPDASTCTPPTAPPAWSSSATVFADAGQGRRRHRQRQERPELLRRPVPEAGVLGRLLGHPQLPDPGANRASLPTRRTTRPTGRRSRGRARTSRPLQPGARAEPDAAKRIEISTRCRSSSTTTAATSSRSSTTWSTATAEGAGLRAEQGHAEPRQFGHGYRTIWFA